MTRQSDTDALATAYDATVEALVCAIYLRDQETEEHTRRVTLITERLARLMGVSNGELVHIRRGALLHDIGKLRVSDAILHKAGPLTEEEWKVMHQHPIWAAETIQPIAYLRPAIDIPYYHHEKWDGTGYPRGLAGEAIPLAARIFAVVDIFDAVRSDRPYRKAWSLSRTLRHIRSLSGTALDPKITKAFLRGIKTGALLG